MDRNGEVHEVRAQAVLLATGGLGQVYRETTNPSVATGDGVAMAFRAGAEVSDMEFVQFHPTALYVPGAPRFLFSEALRGEGAYLRNADWRASCPAITTWRSSPRATWWPAPSPMSSRWRRWTLPWSIST